MKYGRAGKWFIIVAAMVGVLFLGYRVYTIRQAQKNALSGVTLATARAEKRSMEVAIQGKGTICSSDKRQVKCKTSGTVSVVSVSEGTKVNEGDILAVISNETLRIQLEKARFDYEIAKDNLAYLQSPQGSKKDLELDLEEARKNLESTKEKTLSLSIRSPLSGSVWDLAVAPGDYVKPGQILSTVADVSSYLVTARVKQADLAKIHEGAGVTVHGGGDVKPCNGAIRSISNQGSNTGKGVEFAVEVRIDEPDPLLKPGMSVTVVYDLDNVNLSLPGQVEPIAKEDIRAEVDGKVETVFLRTGDFVKEGQLLIILKNEDILSSLERAKRNFDLAQKNLNDWADQITKAEIDLKQKELTLAEKEKDFQNLNVKSPLSGKVISCSIKPGEDVSPGQTLFQVASMNPLIVSIQCDELDVGNVYVGQDSQITVDGLPGETFRGRIRKISQEGQVRDGITNYAVEVEFSSEKAMLSMSSSVSILVSKKDGVLTVPLEAIKWEGQKAYVYCIDGGRVVQRKVSLGLQDDTYVEVLSGLNENEMVLTGDLSRINDVRNVRLPSQVPGIPFRPR